MIEILKGDILQADVDALVNTVNCVGVMGRGIALQFRKSFPDNFKAYEDVCKRGQLHTGMVLTYKLDRLTKPCYVINFPTKEHWKGKSRIEYIESGLQALVIEIKRLGIHSIAVPPLGCGLGGLKWSEVRPIIERAFATIPDVHVLLYQPSGAPDPGSISKNLNPPAMNLSRSILIALVHGYQAALLDVSVSLLEIHKLMYFVQEAGQDLRLHYKKGPFGPYAENLRHALIAIDGYFIRGYGDAHDAPTKNVELGPDAADNAWQYLQEHPESCKRVAQVEDLIEGFETPFGMELLATVHWVVVHDGAATPEEAIQRVYSWSKRKQMFTERQIRLTWNVLEEKGWISTAECRRDHN